jgi:hypothetical protein
VEEKRFTSACPARLSPLLEPYKPDEPCGVRVVRKKGETPLQRTKRVLGYVPPSNVEDPLEEITACDVAGKAQLGAAATTGLADLAEPAPASQSLVSRPCGLCGAHFLLRAGSKKRRCSTPECDRKHLAELAERAAERYRQSLGPVLGECARCSQPARRRHEGQLFCGPHFSSFNRSRRTTSGAHPAAARDGAGQ